METFDEKALRQACNNDDIEYIRKHVEKGRNLESKDTWGYTPLISACVYGGELIARYLVGIGANIEARGCAEMTPIMYASFFGYDKIVRFLVENGADIVAQDVHKSNALSLSISNKHPNTAFFLALTIISRRDLRYENAPIFVFIPKHRSIAEEDHTRIIKNMLPTYLDRSLKDQVFGIAMQRDIEEILGGKKRAGSDALSKKEVGVLKKLLKTLRSIDYTDRVSTPITEYPERSEWRRSRVGRSRTSASGYEDEPEETSPAYDMEL